MELLPEHLREDMLHFMSLVSTGGTTDTPLPQLQSDRKQGHEMSILDLMPIFADCDAGFLRLLVKSLKSVVAAPGTFGGVELYMTFLLRVHGDQNVIIVYVAA